MTAITREELEASDGSSIIGYINVGTDAVQRTLEDRLRDVVSALDFIPANLHAAIRDHSSTTDVTIYVQAAIASLSVSGGAVHFPVGTYRVGDLLLKKGVTLVGSAPTFGGYELTDTRSRLLAIGGPDWVVDTPTAGALMCGIEGMMLQGDGSCGGVRFRSTGSGGWSPTLSHVLIRDVGKQAVLIDSEVAVALLYRVLAFNSVLDRPRSQLTGVIEINGTDATLLAVEANPSLTGVVNESLAATITANRTSGSALLTSASSTAGLVVGQRLAGTGIPSGARLVSISGATLTMDVAATSTAIGGTVTATNMNLYICGILLTGWNNFVGSGCVGEFAERGIHSTNPTNQICNARADLNWGHGFSGTYQGANLKSYNNGQAADNTYDAFCSDDTQSGMLTGCLAMWITADPAPPQYRYGWNGLASNYSSSSSRHMVRAFRSSGHGTAPILQASNGGLPHDVETFGVAQQGDITATPDAAAIGMFIPTNASAVTVTSISGGYLGQVLKIAPTTNNVTLAVTGNIMTNSTASKTLAANTVYTFTYLNLAGAVKWFEAA